MQKQLTKKKPNRFVAWFKHVPWYGWVIAIGLFILQQGSYTLAKPVITGLSHAWRINPKTGIDDRIPFFPYFWMEIYIWSYLFWYFALAHSARKSKQGYLNFLITFGTACVIGFLLLAFIPTYMDRTTNPGGEGLLNPDGTIGPKVQALVNGPSKFLFTLILKLDGGIDNYNLCPSFHNLVSMLCFISVASDKEYHIGRRIYTFLMLILIAGATVFTKQHYFIDIFGGWILGIAAWYLIKIINPGQKIVAKHPHVFEFKKKKQNVATKEIPA